ncbi:MAG TPA: hypothetical protein VKA84_20810, partial [Gemmatimonadaceae bacterium]|nr:hypothetical protein [Gemmatimonadaceae bacterium]
AATPPRATRPAYVDRTGVIRWRDNDEEVALFGANYTLPSASDFRAAGYLGLDRKKLLDVDMAHFARMGWDALRISFWGDWENSDRAGNLVENDHLDLMDYLIAKARERGVYILFSPVTTYDAGWPDSMQASAKLPGFANPSRNFKKSELGTRDSAIAAQANYIRQLLNHVNPYTKTALKDEPAILFVEMINEPEHHSGDVPGSVKYIDALVDAVRSTGSKQITFHNVSQDFAIGQAIARSKVQGVTFGWYPTGLNSGRELQGNYLRSVDDYPAMRSPELARFPRVVYEFDSPDLRTGYMYPAMARAFRAGGVQLAAMFSYDMLGTASRNLGWQTHYLSLAYTPRKAMSAVVAAEAMKRLPRGGSYGAYPQNAKFGDFRVSYEENLGELAAPDAFLYAGSTRTTPPAPARLTRVAGYGSSPVVEYDGEGVYFLDRVRPGVWRLELYPDAVPIRDPFVMPNPEKVVTRALYRSWPMKITLPDLGAAFAVQPVGGGGSGAARAEGGRFAASPGVYILSASGPVDRATLPAWVGRVGLDEFHAPAPDTVPLRVEPLALGRYRRDRPVEIAARVVDAAPPDSVLLWLRPTGSWFRRFWMRPAGAYEYRATIPADSLAEGVYEYAISVARGGASTTFPEGQRQRPWDWDFSGSTFWRTLVVPARTPLTLFTAAEDVPRLHFTRIGDAGRQGLFRVVPSAATGEPAFHLELPVVGGRGADDYTASLVVAERVRAGGDALAGATGLRLRLRGLGPRQLLHVTLVERDGTSWSAAVPVEAAWAERTVPLSEFRAARGVLLPLGFPGRWNYWVGPAAGRGGSGDALRLPEVERFQLSLRDEGGAPPAPGQYGVEIESATLVFQ